MYIFIDESGIHRPVGSSVFAFVYILKKDVQKIETGIAKLEKNIRIDHFHWAESSWPVKKKFFDEIINLSFTFSIKILANPIKPDRALEMAAKEILKRQSFESIYIDGVKPRWYSSRLKKILRDYGISVRTIVMTSDTKSAGLRLADLVAGLIRAYTDGSTQTDLSRMYKKLLKKQNPDLRAGRGQTLR